MSNQSSVIVGTLEGIKSIPLNALPESSWTYVTGKSDGADAAEDVLARYEDIPWLYRAVNARCNALVAVQHTISPVNFPDDERDIEDELPWLDDFLSILEMLERWYILYGRAYAHIVRNRFGQVIDFAPMHPDIVKPIWSPSDGTLQGFFRDIPGKPKQPLTLEEVFYWWKPPYRTELGWGVSDAKVAMKASGVLYYMDTHSGRLFASGAINPTIISLAASTQEADRSRVESWARKTLGGIRKAFSITAVSGEVKTTTIGQDLNKLAVPDLTQTKREDVATALGVPQTKLFSNAANYATARNDSLQMYEETIKPDSRQLVRRLNKFLFKPLGYTLYAHFERLEIYQASEADKMANMEIGVRSGILDIDEARVELDYEPRKDRTEQAEPATSTPTDAEPDARSQEAPLTKALSQWRRKALTRHKEGHLQKALEFESDIIPPSIKGAIRGALRNIHSAEDISRVFNHATIWQSYP